MDLFSATTDAIEQRDWRRALWHVLELWREHRDPTLASAIDLIAARIPAAAAGRRTPFHEWWMSLAVPYSAAEVAALVPTASNRMKADDTAHERMRAVIDWPDDPRAATILVDWLVIAPVRWDSLEFATADFYGEIADRLGGLRDLRVMPLLEACQAYPRGATQTLRYLQSRLAQRVLQELQRLALVPLPRTERAIVEAWLGSLTGPVQLEQAHPRDLDALWAEVAARRDDIEPRIVLGDALIERGDPRGELVILQCTSTAEAASRAKQLLSRHWETVLGDLALVLNRKGTVFSRGMLETVRVGVPKSPGWAFERVHGNRELATVRTVRPGYVRPADYAAFLTSPNLTPDRVAIDAPEIITELRRRRPRWTFTALEYGHHSVRDTYRSDFLPLARTFEAIAALCPGLEEIRFESMQWPNGIWNELLGLVRTLPAKFANLQRIVLDSEWFRVHTVPPDLPLVIST